MAKNALGKQQGPGLLGTIVVAVLLLIVATWVLRIIFKVVWFVIIVVILVTAIPVVAGLVVRSFRRPRL